MISPELDDDRLKEECGVLGVYTPDGQAAHVAFFGLFALQHRGQESAGIAVSDGSRVKMHRQMGLVNQVFDSEALACLPGHIAVGHTRYSTTGASVLHNVQPVFCQSLIGEIAVAHNGNLINARELRAEMEEDGEVFDTTSDSEILARILVQSLHLGPQIALAELMKRVKGAYSVTVLTSKTLIGFRDPSGIRPLSAGRVNSGYILASETCAFGPVGAEPIRELKPGEAVVIDSNGIEFFQAHEPEPGGMCLFEFIYFARPDSIMYNKLLYNARERMGENLADEHPVTADVVVPVPDSGIPAALGYARKSGIPFREGMTKSRYIHRTFIAPDQRLRELGVRMKLTPLVDHIRGQRIVLVDDSIVRGTTTRQIVKMLFESGAAEVHVRITAPPIKFPCFYGIDMASKGELAAARMSLEELTKYIGATTLGFLSIEGAVEAAGGDKSRFCLACFNGDYPIQVPKDLSKHAFDDPPCVGEIASVSGGQTRFQFE
ncbi:MAG TPA: amidophosphoribosyltransferase [Fimbriimonas sp.]|nr:amidophosphoribosyltransferase [Fimbriimonas sp.]